MPQTSKEVLKIFSDSGTIIASFTPPLLKDQTKVGWNYLPALW